jgi:hypothetical protein
MRGMESPEEKNSRMKKIKKVEKGNVHFTNGKVEKYDERKHGTDLRFNK